MVHIPKYTKEIHTKMENDAQKSVQQMFKILAAWLFEKQKTVNFELTSISQSKKVNLCLSYQKVDQQLIPLYSL